jgi:putative copper resistance protein D
LAGLVGAGHGVSGSGTLGIVHATADVMHLLGAAAWLGALAALARLLGEHSPEMIRHALPRFSCLGYGAVAVLLLTGCINTASLMTVLSASTEPIGGENNRANSLRDCFLISKRQHASV